MQGKEDDKVEGLLNVKDLRRQTTANEEKLVISASANGNNQSGNSSAPECSSLISVIRQNQSHIFDDSASRFFDCHTSRSKTTEVVAEQSQKIKMYIKTTNLNHKLSLQQRIKNLCIFLYSQNCSVDLFLRTKFVQRKRSSCLRKDGCTL